MEIKNFEELREKIVISKKKTVAVVCAHDEHTLEAVLKAYEENLLDYYLIGQKKEIIKKAEKIGFEIQTNRIVDCITDEESAKVAVHMAKEKKVDFIQKGLMQTSTLLKAVVNKESGIGKGTPMSHIALLDIPGYHKILGVTDGGMILYPDLEMKKAIIKNTAEMFRKAGYVKPKIAVVCAVEVENLKMPETVDAGLLKKMALTGEYGECYVDGPVSMDIAVDMEASRIKKYSSPVAGDTDIIVVPNITAGNIMVKGLLEFADAKMAGIVTGAEVPIALNSRSASLEEKYYSLLAFCFMSV